MENRFLRLTIFISIAITLFSFWDHHLVSYLKDFIVFVHELGHAIAALLTGGSVHTIELHGNESGETIAIPNSGSGSFIFVVSAGYLGSCLIGGFLLNRGFSGKMIRPTLISFGAILLLMTVSYSKPGNLAQYTGILWGLGFVLLGFLNLKFNPFVLVFMGTSITLYGLYDLLDFTGNIVHTDAGIMAAWITGANASKNVPKSVIVLGYLIALLWSFFSLSIIFISVKKIFQPAPREEFSTEENPFLDPYNTSLEAPFPGDVTPEVMEWFFSKGLDLNGKPLPAEFLEKEES
ncbi:M50 family peptidase [Leptospira gomenensis]|uniref:M50 family peptidase n=1 Tax=Leptospira gomenensis TaxID=2484974 RepID=A0A5F1Y5T1_9LEPT|nr:M50 family metallopeptidase [Leptospira gomenensis]TGK28043.1 M50 family peptidase [Leptospira gomenensis]TGK37102.1 M50 family peptidase [Leptospira gomenensis]TGK45738.1 M50 family peptidase [Leptospira gomenensis]TGK59677.1 M50 family peptidase [Leptospira gomenensis]